MRQLPLYVLTVFVAISLTYAFMAPFHGGVGTPAVTGQDVDITPEDFELPDEMKNDVPDAEPEAAPLKGRVTSPEARQVNPDAPALPDSQSTPLERVEPRQPLSQLGQAATVAPPPPPVPVDNTAKPLLLYQPVALAAGTIEASGYKIALDGIETLPIEETCSAGDGASWPCGMAARTAFRNWLRSRAIECDVPGQPTDDVIATHCKLGNADLAQWLVENGWARVKHGTPMADAMKKAEEEKRGIFGEAPAALPVTQEVPMPSFSDTLLPTEEPAVTPPPLTAPDAPFPPRPQ
ncbi:thermonuclease family protein [Phyllobacterium lublinensis]|uniref:thermonuclease family protein n=1 Tax=Phyllobacterium lublinensis TaxID=2875708 RepID=UPI001CCF0D90|nr:thermonuclease family protein [Phyllobacterium sp. 2063]MBZ9656278.1 thermonuclease family protein [Phyllobacterium sp. 2063]